MGCEFKIKTSTLKRSIQLVKAVLPKGVNSSILNFYIKENKALITTKTFGTYLKQVVEVESIMNGTFSIDLDFFKTNFKEEYVRFKISKRNSKSTENVMLFQSGNLSGSILLEMLDDIKIPKKQVDLTHNFEYNSFINGLKFLSFKSLKKDKNKIIKIFAQDGEMLFNTNDTHRGACFWTSTSINNNLDVSVDFTSIFSILKLLPENKPIQFGATDRLVHIKSGSIDYQFPYLTGNVKDVKKMINIKEKEKPKYSFNIEISDLKSIIHTIDNSKGKEIPIYMNIKKGKKIKKTPNDKDYVIFYTKSDFSTMKYKVIVDEVINEGLVATTNKLLDSLFLMDGYICMKFYENIIVIHSLKYNLSFFIPQYILK